MDRSSPDADLLLDATVNGPKTFSLAAMLDPELEAAFESMQDRLRDRILHMWQAELNTRRGRNGVVREALSRIEVVELKHERSRARPAQAPSPVAVDQGARGGREVEPRRLPCRHEVPDRRQRRGRSRCPNRP